MCTLAAEDTSSWLMIDPWEAFQSYQRTAVVLDHFDYELNNVLGGVQTADGEHRNVRVMLLAGSDLIGTMSQPGVWSQQDVSSILVLTITVEVLLTSTVVCRLGPTSDNVLSALA